MWTGLLNAAATFFRCGVRVSRICMLMVLWFFLAHEARFFWFSVCGDYDSGTPGGQGSRGRSRMDADCDRVSKLFDHCGRKLCRNAKPRHAAVAALAALAGKVLEAGRGSRTMLTVVSRGAHGGHRKEKTFLSPCPLRTRRTSAATGLIRVWLSSARAQ